MTELLVLLFVLGIALILAETLLPGGILGAIGGVLVVLSAVGAAMKFPDYAVLIIAGEFIGAVLTFLIGFATLRRSALGKALTLRTSQQQQSGWVSNESDAALIGQTGEVYTRLRPVGTVTVNGQRLQAVAEGTYIEKGKTIRVIDVHGNRVVVEEVSASGSA